MALHHKKERDNSTLKYIGLSAAAVFLTWMLHEFAHWCTGELLGNRMIMTLNASYPELGSYNSQWHDTAVSAAGPLITVMQALLFYVILRKTSNKFLFPFLVVCLYMRALAGVLNVINLNDEGRISSHFKLGPYTLSLMLTGFLLYLTYTAAKSMSLKTGFVLYSLFLIMLFSSILVLTDQALAVKIL